MTFDPCKYMSMYLRPSVFFVNLYHVIQDSTQASTSTNEASAVPPSLEAAPSQAPPTEDDKEREARERRERAQEYRTQKNIRGHVRTAYRCMQHADRVLLRYKVC